jgi:aminoglycoside N3'-acetyltransferase
VSVADDISGLLSRLGTGPVFVHSDPFRAAALVPRSRDKEVFVDSHIALLEEAAKSRGLWMPAFNYDFPRTRIFDVKNDPSHLGPITERFRVGRAEWRTEIPIFSATGIGEPPAVVWGEWTDPFGPESLFARLVEADGVMLYYGDTFHYNTLVHHAERVVGGPPYRYDKLFRGIVKHPDGTSKEGSLNYHVRPLGKGLDYDWNSLRARSIEKGVCVQLENRPEILSSSARSLRDFFVEEMKADPLALLDDESRRWVAPELQRLGRRFLIGDFEGESVS